MAEDFYFTSGVGHFSSQVLWRLGKFNVDVQTAVISQVDVACYNPRGERMTTGKL